VRPFLVSLILWMAVWLVLTGGQLSAALIGLPVAAAAAWASCRFAGFPAWRLRPLAALQFALSFVWNSILAGADIARRTTGLR
jgi:multicomponent Na+:H+ antiporter subunit E